MGSKIRFGVIGCGSVSGTYLYSLKNNINSNLVAIADVDFDKAKESAKTFDVKKVYSDYREMLSREKLDAVVVCTPHYLHKEQTLAGFEKGLHVLCEKPLATNIGDIDEMIKAGENLKFGVMLQRRFYPNSISTREAIQRGLLGKIEEISLNFSCHKSDEFYNTWRGKSISGGGTLISQALHRIDQLIYFFGPAKAVDGTIKKTRQIEVEDYASGKIFFDNGRIAKIESNNSSGNPETISIIKIKGDLGNIVLSDDKILEWNINGLSKPVELDIKDIPTKYRPEYYGPAHELVINDFVDSVRLDKKLRVSGRDSRDSMNIIFGFYKSAAEKRKVVL